MKILAIVLSVILVGGAITEFFTRIRHYGDKKCRISWTILMLLDCIFGIGWITMFCNELQISNVLIVVIIMGAAVLLVVTEVANSELSDVVDNNRKKSLVYKLFHNNSSIFAKPPIITEMLIGIAMVIATIAYII